MTGAFAAMCGGGRPQPISIGALWVDIVQTAPTPAANTNVTLTVPTGNPGNLRFEIVGAGEEIQYRKNSGTYTAFDDGAIVNFANGDTLNFRANNGTAGPVYDIEVYDNVTATLLDTFNVEVV